MYSDTKEVVEDFISGRLADIVDEVEDDFAILVGNSSTDLKEGALVSVKTEIGEVLVKVIIDDDLPDSLYPGIV